ncbi:MAG: hypothetical protein WED05_05200 [Candidatus Atabeyarchaeum deiterrae]
MSKDESGKGLKGYRAISVFSLYFSAAHKEGCEPAMGNLEFCPKCGKLLLPRKEGKSITMKCKGCGATYKPKDLDAYKLKVMIPPKAKERLVVVEGGVRKKGTELTEDERVEAYRQALDYYQGEEETGEEQ